MPTLGSLFAGIGGLDLGLERAGWEVRWQVEIDDFCRKVLERHWPLVRRYGDIREIRDGDLEPVDLICGGFPCQPVSLAGRRRGEADERWLWPEFARILRVVRPRFVLVENVPGLLSRGMGQVLGDLAALGYDAEWQSLPAAAFGAPHLRYRVFIVAYASGGGYDGRRENAVGFSGAVESRTQGGSHAMAHTEGFPGEVWPTEGERPERPPGGGDAVAHATSGRRGRTRREQEQRPFQDEEGKAVDASASRKTMAHAALQLPHGGGDAGSGRPESSVRRAVDNSLGAGPQIFPRQPRDFAEELASSQRAGEWWEWWTVEPDVGRVAYGISARVDRLRGLGNAVVPPVAEWIGRRILEYDQGHAAAVSVPLP